MPRRPAIPSSSPFFTESAIMTSAEIIQRTEYFSFRSPRLMKSMTKANRATEPIMAIIWKRYIETRSFERLSVLFHEVYQYGQEHLCHVVDRLHRSNG